MVAPGPDGKDVCVPIVLLIPSLTVSTSAFPAPSTELHLICVSLETRQFKAVYFLPDAPPYFTTGLYPVPAGPKFEPVTTIVVACEGIMGSVAVDAPLIDGRGYERVAEDAWLS